MFRSLAGHDRSWWRGDLIAGLTVWAVLVPEALAYATIAGVSPVVGLYAAPPTLILYAAFGSSRHLIVGPMSATAALSAAAVADVTTGGPDDVLAFTSVLAIVTGALAIVAWVLRFGFLANFMSEPVLKGFIIGLALTIIIGQVPKLFGIEKEDGDFFRQLWGVVSNLGDTQARTLVVGVMSLVIVLALRHYAPVVPASLIAVIVGVVAVNVFDLADKGVEIVGPIDGGLPSLGLPGRVAAALALRASRPYVAELGQVAGTSAQFGDRDRHPENTPVPGVAVLRVESGLFFANADPVRRAIREHAARPGVHGVVLDAEAMPFVDVTALRMLDELAEQLRHDGQHLVIAHAHGQVGDLLAHSPDDTDLRVFSTIDEAVASIDGP